MRRTKRISIIIGITTFIIGGLVWGKEANATELDLSDNEKYNGNI